MTEEIKYIPVTPRATKPNIQAKNGWVVLCAYCGEQIGNTQKFCPSCKTKSGREEVLNQNLAILNELRKKGYCKQAVELLAA